MSVPTKPKPDLPLRMANAIEAVLPLIRDMWASFPYAEMPGDDAKVRELDDAAREWRRAGGARQKVLRSDAKHFQPPAD